ncbi:hypothetical protein N8925_04340 [Candidatus Pelagibacter sp.]|nr:hypothetical protein [Candidatus Pelagibacter sp.]
MALHKILNKISINLSIKFFGARLPLSYVFFNTIFKKFIINRSVESEFIKKYYEDGFVKLNLNLANELNHIKEKMLPEGKNEKKQILKLDEITQNFLKKILLKKFDKTFKDLEKYFNSNIVIANVNLFRNHHAPNVIEGKSEQVYSNYYHNDGYVLTYFKMFINLMDVSEKDGPLHIISKKKTKVFFNEAKYKDRYDYTPIKNEKLIYKNTGKYGDCFLFSTPECIHKAGIPDNYRDILQLTLIASPNKNIKNENLDVFNDNSDIIFTTKPYTVMKVFNLLLKHFFFRKKSLIRS